MANFLVSFMLAFGVLAAASRVGGQDAHVDVPEIVAHVDVPELVVKNGTLTPDEIGQIVEWFGGDQYIVSTQATLVEGLFVKLGPDFGKVEEGEFAPGAWICMGSDDEMAMVAIGDAQETMRLGDILIINPKPARIEGANDEYDRHCIVTCGTGWFACCTWGTNGNAPLCRCKPDSQADSSNCAAGGPGAVSCELEWDTTDTSDNTNGESSRAQQQGN